MAVTVSVAEPPAVETFAALPQFVDPVLSPDGRHLGVQAYRDGRYVLVIYDLDNIATKKPLVIATDPWSVSQMKWANNERVLITIVHAIDDYLENLYVQQLTAFDIDGSNALIFKPPGTKAKNRWDPKFYLSDNIIDMLADDPEHVLISWNPDNVKKPRLYKMNVYTSKMKLVQKGKRAVQSWLVDQKGLPRVGGGLAEGMMSAVYRPADGKQWKTLFRRPFKERTTFRAVLIDAVDPDVAWVLSDFESDNIGLYKYRLSTASFIEEVFRHSDVDVYDVRFDRDRTEIRGVEYVDQSLGTHWLSLLEPHLLTKIKDRLQGASIFIVSESADLKRFVIGAYADDRPVRYYLYEPEKDQLQFFAHTFPQLDGKALSGTHMMSYQTRDDTRIEAFVNLPAGVSYPPQEPLPTIIMPHGGPAARSYGGFDPLVQLLNSRGYAVLQMNFRGSAGYGREFRMAGERQWGQVMQDDVTDGTQWMIEQGVADPDRICIVGGSYGGYAALMGAIKTPDLFQCAVSLNGVSDLKDLMARSRRFAFGTEVNSFIAGWGDSAMLDENSPTKRAAEIKIPILLAHSTKDSVVLFKQSEKMAKALDKAGKDYQFLPLENGDHSLRLGGVRPVFYEALVEFLNKQLH